ncbi:DUF308 domain-containing protein [Microbacterium jejuense]|uniref:DUF308 domain-containing protein n=1 Tax=Microbacterium jejuense TaxID=1263637 RepID=A0ABS7HPY8_9MICO|nr:lipase family protein [Microbacterium jejuense]MBW9095026.1 DUF308 domain-containing protein [Microbacterium jejuense]
MAKTREARRSAIGDWYARRPRWVHGTIGVLTVALGAVILVRPTTSLGVLALLIGAGLVVNGILELVTRDGAARAWWRWALSALWILAGLFVLAWPGLTVRVLVLVVGIGLMVGGAGRIVEAFRVRQSLDARIAAGVLGAAEVVFGVLAVLWPDITGLVVAVVFGARLVIVGLLELWHAIRPPRLDAEPAAPSGLSRWTRTIAAVAALVVAVGAGAVSVSLRGGSPVVDEFYAAPRTVPSEPGALIRSEPFTRGVPEDAEAWRILYTTTNGDGTPAVASGLVVVPKSGDGAWPVIEWSHGTTGFAQQCAPSLLAEPFESGALFLLPQIVDRGWALVATDYIGLGTAGPHPYLVGEPSARASLDAVRAARELESADLGPQTVAWGHSQGGGAALWVGAVGADYAPDVPLSGVAALAPASQLPAFVGSLDEITGGSVFASYVIAGYSGVYPDVTYRQYVRPGAEVTVRELATRCLAEPAMGASLLTLLGMTADPDIFAADPTTGPMGERMRENVPPATGDAPLLLGQGLADPLIVPSAQDAYVDGLCADGRQVDYRLYAGRGHVELVQPDSPLIPELLQWTEDRFADVPAEAGCTRREE